MKSDLPDSAVFWDFQNIGVPHDSSLAKDIIETLKKKGRVVAAYAYADWKICSKETASMLYKHRYQLLHIPNPTKNSADVLMTAHAMAHISIAPNILQYVLISNDYDFRPLTLNLQQLGKRVILICRPVDTSPDLLEMVDEYIDLQTISENMSTTLFEPEPIVEIEHTTNKDTQQISAFAQLQETVREIENRGYQAGLGYTKIVLVSLNPGFNECDLGFEKWGDFVAAAAKAGFIKLSGTGAATILSIPEVIDHSAEISIRTLQDGFTFLIQTVKEMEQEGKTTELVHVASRIHTKNPSFDIKGMGFKKFSDFVFAAERRGLIHVEHVFGRQPLIRTVDFN